MKKSWIVFPVALALITGFILAAAGCPGDTDTKKTLVSIAVTTPPDKTTYNLGDTGLDTTGLVVTATYSDKSKAPVTGYETSGFSSSTEGSKTITVTYQGKTARFTINVIDPNKETVATPTASPVAGAVPINTQVTLSTATSGAQIWYTTNGSTPAREGPGSTRYTTTPIPINRALTIKAIAIRDGWNNSGILEAAYTVETGAYTIHQLGGTEHKQDTEYLIFTFDGTIERDGLLMEDITVIPGTGNITPVFLTNSRGPTRQLTILVVEQGTVNIKITKAGISAAERTITVYKKTGYQPDPGVTIADIVKFGTPALPDGSDITFARSDGDPIAILPPRTPEPITSISAASPAFEKVIAVFDPPLDLTTAPTRDFKWFDMVWDGFGRTFDFDGTQLNLHMVTFQLELTTSEDQAIVIQKRSDTNTSTGDKNPVRFLKSDITSGTWGTGQGTGHRIKAITVRASGMQFRNPENTSWPNVSATNAPVIEDTWIISLTVNTVPASLPKVLYSTTGAGTEDDPYVGAWHDDITNPRWALADIGSDEADAATLPSWTGLDGEQKIVYWDPISTVDSIVNEAAGFTVADEYSTIVLSYTGATHYWYGYGSISGNPDEGREGVIKQQVFDGSQISPANGIRIPLRSAAYTPDNFDATMFSGFFLQWNSGAIHITGIRVE